MVVSLTTALGPAELAKTVFLLLPSELSTCHEEVAAMVGLSEEACKSEVLHDLRAG